MQKLCIPVLTLLLGAPSPAQASDDKTPALPEAGVAKASASASASATAKIAISDQDALNDDILAVIDLPLAVDDAREAGIEETELKVALDSTQTAGLSAGAATEVVAEEADAARGARGVKKGFGQWVRLQLAAGLTGKKLATKIKSRKDELSQADELQQKELKEKLDKQQAINSAWREKQLERRAELLAKGKKRVLLHQERHAKLQARVDAAQTKVDGAQAKVDARQDDVAARMRELDAKIAAAGDADKAALEAEKKRLEKAAARLDKAEDKLGKAEDKLDKREDKLDKQEDKAAKHDAKLDAKLDKVSNKPTEPKQPVPRPTTGPGGKAESKGASDKVKPAGAGAAPQ